MLPTRSRPGRSPPKPLLRPGRLAFASNPVIFDDLLYRIGDALLGPTSINCGSDQIGNGITNCLLAFRLTGGIAAWSTDDHRCFPLSICYQALLLNA